VRLYWIYFYSLKAFHIMSARQEPSLSCTISRHGIAKPSFSLFIWLIEKAVFSFDVGRSLRPAELYT
jgi:hypothetical protein